MNEKLDKPSTNDNEKLDKLATNVDEKLDKQAHNLELLTMSMNKSFSSTAAISTKLENHSADLVNHDGRLKTHDVLQTKTYQLVQSKRPFFCLTRALQGSLKVQVKEIFKTWKIYHIKS